MVLSLWTQIVALGLPEPEVEFVFHPKRKWKFDGAWPDANPPLAVEIEGGLYGRGKPCPLCKRRAVGAHSSIERLLSDMEKYNEAALMGWDVIRCTPAMVKDGTALTLVERAFALRAAENAALQEEKG